MEQLDNLQALTQSIGEHILDLVGRDALYGLQVVLDARSMDADVTLALRDTSWAEQERVWRRIFEIEHIFWDDVVLQWQFVESAEAIPSSMPGTVEYSYA